MVPLWRPYRRALGLTHVPWFLKVFAFKTSVATSQCGSAVTQTGAVHPVRRWPRGPRRSRVNSRKFARDCEVDWRVSAEETLSKPVIFLGEEKMDALPLAGNLSLYELLRQAVPETVLGAFAVVVVIALFLSLVAVWLWFWRLDENAANASSEPGETVDFTHVEVGTRAFEAVARRKS
jgi:hypothetical protein